MSQQSKHDLGKVQVQVNLDPTEKAIFWKIITETEGGKLYRMLTKGTTTPQQKNDVWEFIQKMFCSEIGKSISSLKLRKLFGRMKLKINQKHDADLTKQFNKDCAKTGGGPGPTQPEGEDGDTFYNENNTLDPTPTPWNQVSRERGSLGLVTPEVPTPPSPSTYIQASPSAHRSTPTKIGLRIGQILQESNSRSSQPSPSQTRRPLPRFLPFQNSPLTTSDGLPPGSTNTPQPTSSAVFDTVTIINPDGTSSNVPVETESNNNISAPGKSKKKSKVDAATAYYTKMLSVQTRTEKMKAKVLRAKLLTERMKQTLMVDKFAAAKLDIPTLSESSESDSDGEVEEDNVNI